MSSFDLSKTVKNIDDEPILSGDTLVPKNPVDITIKQSGQEIENVSAIIRDGDALTYRKAIQNALLADANPQQSQMPDKHKRSMLALKLTADKDVKFKSDEITTIKESAKNAPQTSTVVYMRLVELLDPAEVEG